MTATKHDNSDVNEQNVDKKITLEENMFDATTTVEATVKAPSTTTIKHRDSNTAEIMTLIKRPRQMTTTLS